eukprot:Unigene9116_Nuclearia_a/m.27878 Unigene9116_Nuclearia_a/g.27878  ORF Unigene9116_Nuclearia_a/g.27878 Unigene9116_Nuclearia_a/m.27878 type:complete len:424 (-) Unigene9116_Nuclearia_a:28-1299(-)
MASTPTLAPPTVAIIGGGLGGLVLAHALRRANVPAVVYERDASATARDQGYQIGLAEPGLAALDRIMFPALRELLAAEASDPDFALRGFTMLTGRLGVLMQLRLGFSERAMGVNRWRLREVLAQGPPDAPLDIRWNKRFVRYEEVPDLDGYGRRGVRVHFEDGTTAEADVVVGADGAKSPVRAQRSPQLHLEETHVVNVGGITPYPAPDVAPVLRSLPRNSMMRALGSNGSSLLLIPWRAPTGERKLLWSLTQADDVPGALEAATDTSSTEATLSFCLRQLDKGGYHDELRKAVAQSEHSNILRDARLLSVMVPPDVNPLGQTTRVTLLGDAAHAMTTHMGLGANTAMQDAIDLADALRRDDWSEALAAYETTMLRRGLTNARNSLGMTRMLVVRSLWARAVRRVFLSVMGTLLWLGSLFQRS